MAGAKKKKAEEVKTVENVNLVVGNEEKKMQRIILKKDTELRKFPTLQKEHIVGMGKAGTGYMVQHVIGGIYGWFYKLDNGNYVVKDGDYTII